MSLFAVITSANKHDIKEVTDVIYNTFINRPAVLLFTTKGRKRRRKQHLCLDMTYKSELIAGDNQTRFVSHIPYKRKRGEKEKDKLYQKRYPARR